MKPGTIGLVYVILDACRWYNIFNYIEEDYIVFLPLDDSMTTFGNPSVYAYICHFL